jgi:hypothetical protein
MAMAAPQNPSFPSPCRRIFFTFVSMTLMTCGLQAQVAPATSSLREAGGLKLNCPVPLAEKDAGPNEMMHGQVHYSAKTEGVEVLIVSLDYKDEVELDVENIAQGGGANMSKLEGVTNPVVEIKSPALKGADAARHVSFKADRFGKILRGENTYIKKGQHIWVVMITFEGSNKRAIFVGETISKSIRLE